MGKIVRSVEFEDAASPRCAQYVLSLKQLSEGYVVDISWGASNALPCREMYYRPTLIEANKKFERIMAAKTNAKRKSTRTYRQKIEADYREAVMLTQETLPYLENTCG